jgi:flagellar biosynthesis anti-sigma factor FlgM
MEKKKKALVINLKPYRSTVKIKNKITNRKYFLSQDYTGIIKEINMIKKIIQEASDIRVNKVAELRTAIKNGTYTVNSKKIAEKLIKESFLQHNYKPKNRDC